MSDVEGCILGVKFSYRNPWVCSWPVLTCHGYGWQHLVIHELDLAELHPLVRTPAKPRAVLGMLLEFPWALGPVLVCLSSRSQSCGFSAAQKLILVMLLLSRKNPRHGMLPAVKAL